MAGKLEAFATKHGIKYFLFNFTDLLQHCKAIHLAHGSQDSRLIWI